MAAKGQPKTGGRRKGTPNKATAEVRALAQEHGADAIAMLVSMMHGASSEAARIAAANAIL